MLLLRSFLQPAGFPGRLFLFVCVWQHFFMRLVSVLLLRRFGEPKGAEEMTLRELMNQIERTNGKKLPTAAWLRIVVVKCFCNTYG